MDRTSAANYGLNAAGNRIRVPVNVATGTPGTEVDSTYDNNLQEELVGGLLEAVGIVPDAANLRQVQQALYRLFGGNITDITATQTLTPDNAGIVLVDATAGNVVLTLPRVAAANGTVLRFLFVRTDATTNSVTINPVAGDTVLPGSLTTLSLSAVTPISLVGNGGQGGVTVWTDVLSGYITTGDLTTALNGYAPITDVGIARVAVFTSPRSYGWTAPPGVTEVLVTMSGGGGGGAYSGGGGGGAQAVYRQVLSVVPGTLYYITVGAAGVGGTSTSTSGTAGGASSFGTLLTCSGGGGGTPTLGGAAGGPNAFAGSAGVYESNVGQFSGWGGSALLGSGGAPGNGANATMPGQTPGGWGGGGGGGGPGVGGNGAGGVVIVEW
ncbi:glycine-rich domain-containing protein [Acidocella sp.]|uniref:glycine-rich domain-containing protein n=1 Tax=Acidocella sp. TaxID=50710 RepID=UPI00263037FB|nr:hypothetical protein [Acidocella sp.]